MQIDLKRFHAAFFDEAAEHLAVMEESLLALERTPEDGELLNRIFRAAHSVKGASGTFGFTDIATFTHSLESLLDRMRDREILPTPALVELLLKSADVLGGFGGRREGRRSVAGGGGGTCHSLGRGPPWRPREFRGSTGKGRRLRRPRRPAPASTGSIRARA